MYETRSCILQGIPFVYELFSSSCMPSLKLIIINVVCVPEKELRQVQELFGQAADNCLNLKKPDWCKGSAGGSTVFLDLLESLQPPPT